MLIGRRVLIIKGSLIDEGDPGMGGGGAWIKLAQLKDKNEKNKYW